MLELINYFSSLFEDYFTKNVEKSSIKFEFNDVPRFVETENGYELKIKLGQDSKEDGISIDLVDRVLDLQYKRVTESHTFSKTVCVMLPKDSDDKTLDAIYQDGTVTITVKKKS